jgi:hypothetical protein
VQQKVCQWIWSWSYPYCETQEEFILSKALFPEYIESEEVRDALGKSGLVQLKDFFRKRIEPIEDFFVFYKHKHLFHLDTNSNKATMAPTSYGSTK